MLPDFERPNESVTSGWTRERGGSAELLMDLELYAIAMSFVVGMLRDPGA
jgi:hypothetical protein